MRGTVFACHCGIALSIVPVINREFDTGDFEDQDVGISEKIRLTSEPEGGILPRMTAEDSRFLRGYNAKAPAEEV